MVPVTNQSCILPVFFLGNQWVCRDLLQSMGDSNRQEWEALRSSAPKGLTSWGGWLPEATQTRSSNLHLSQPIASSPSPRLQNLKQLGQNCIQLCWQERLVSQVRVPWCSHPHPSMTGCLQSTNPAGIFSKQSQLNSWTWQLLGFKAVGAPPSWPFNTVPHGWPPQL